MTMQKIHVTSSDIKTIGYDEESQILEVEFINGGVYQYFYVPILVYENFLNAPSKGKYLHDVIRNSYRYQKIH